MEGYKRYDMVYTENKELILIENPNGDLYIKDGNVIMVSGKIIPKYVAGIDEYDSRSSSKSLGVDYL